MALALSVERAATIRQATTSSTSLMAIKPVTVVDIKNLREREVH